MKMLQVQFADDKPSYEWGDGKKNVW